MTGERDSFHALGTGATKEQLQATLDILVMFPLCRLTNVNIYLISSIFNIEDAAFPRSRAASLPNDSAKGSR